MRCPAGELEQLIETRLRALLSSEAELFDIIEAEITEIDDRRRIMTRAATLAERWTRLDPAAKKARLQAFIHRIQVHKDRVVMQVKPGRLTEIVDPDRDPATLTLAAANDEPLISLTIEASLQRSGRAAALAIGGADIRSPDRSMLRLLALAQRYHAIVMNSPDKSLRRLAEETGVARSYFNRIFRLAFLAPDIVRALLQGRQPEALTARRLSFDIKLDPRWDQQRKQLGFV
jgi:hypothetical protein